MRAIHEIGNAKGFYLIHNLNFTILINCYRSIFIQMLPYVGTESSSLYTRNLITSGRISDKEALSLLRVLPSYIREPTKQLLLDLEILIEKNNKLPSDVRDSAILSYSYLISRVNKNLNRPDDYMVDKYLQHFSNSFKGESNNLSSASHWRSKFE